MQQTTLIIKFRPSSHSEDGTIVATFEKREVAKKALEKLDQVLQCASCSVFKKKVKVKCGDCEYGTLDRATHILVRFGAKSVEEVGSYQELTITVTLPPKVTIETSPLVLDKNTASIIKELVAICPRPKQKMTEKETVYTFKYSGPSIFMPLLFVQSESPRGTLWIRGNQTHPIPESITITGLI